MRSFCFRLFITLISILIMVFNGGCSHGQHFGSLTNSKGNMGSLIDTASGTKLLSKEYGNGDQTVILVHGGPGLPGYMGTLGRLIQEKFRIVEYYQRDSIAAISNGPFTFSDNVQDLVSVVKYYSRFGKPILIGHSGGASIAIEASKLISPNIKKLIIIDSAPLDIKSLDIFEKRLSRRLEKLVPGWRAKMKVATKKLEAAKNESPEKRFLLFQKLNDLYWPAYFVKGKKSSELFFEPTNLDATNSIAADWEKQLKAGALSKNLSQISTFVVQIYGSEDLLPWKKTSDLLKKNIKNYSIVQINNAGHFPWLDLEARADFLKVLLQALAN
jgi:pimeloyl-ACP methyl ester carboxylesterase